MNADGKEEQTVTCFKTLQRKENWGALRGAIHDIKMGQ